MRRFVGNSRLLSSVVAAGAAVALLVACLAGTLAPPAAARPAAAATGPGDAPVASVASPGRAVLYAAEPVTAPSANPGSGTESGRAAARASSRACSVGTGSTICTLYSGFSAQAQTAYQAATQVWANLVTSPVTITISVDFADLGSNVLAATGPNELYQFTEGGAWTPQALADAETGQDLDPGSADISSSMGATSDVPWYFGTDGRPPAGTYDFESVAIHEIAHGLGIFSFADVPQGTFLGAFDFPGQGPSHPAHTVYDSFLVEGALGQSWLTTGPQDQPAAFPNDSPELYSAFTSGDLYWAGPAGTAAAGGSRPQIEASATWVPGSSISHLAQSAYPWAGPNGLETPYVPSGQANHRPGPILLGMLRDLGWTEVTRPRILGTLAAGPTPDPAVGSAYLAWLPAVSGTDGISPVTGYRLQAGRLDGTGSVITTQVGPDARDAAIGGLTTGVAYWVSVSPLGSSPGSGTAATVVPQDLGPTYVNLLQLLQDVMPNLLGGPSPAVTAGVLGALSRTSPLTTTVTELVNLNAFVLNNVLGPVTRLYEAYFGRLPDQGGAAYWVARLRSGTALAAISNYFAGSSEFRNTYGTLSDAAFVTRVYRNVLDRNPDAGGYGYWLGRLASGMSRGALMLYFSESSENTRHEAPTVRVVEAWWVMRGTVPSDAQVAANGWRSSASLFQALLDETI